MTTPPNPEVPRWLDELHRLAHERVTAESKWLDEGIAALIRAGVPLGRISVQYWPQGKGSDPTPFSRVVALGPVEPPGDLGEWRPDSYVFRTEESMRNKAIAAELRRLADECRPCAGWMDGYNGSEDPEWLAHRLRARANQLDPQPATTESAG